MRSRVRYLAPALAIALVGLTASCELILDIDDGGEEPAPNFPDAGLAPVPDAGPALRACFIDSAYEDLGVPNRTYRSLGGFDWFSGRDRCLDDGADIVSINGTVEHEAMIRYLTRFPVHVNCPGGPCAWVGLSQQSIGDPTEGWTWADGEPDDGTLWALPQQPDDIDGMESGEENCAMMELDVLFDERCSLEWFTICECNLTVP